MLVTTQWPLKRTATSPHLSGFVFYGCLESLTELSALCCSIINENICTTLMPRRWRAKIKFEWEKLHKYVKLQSGLFTTWSNKPASHLSHIPQCTTLGQKCSHFCSNVVYCGICDRCFVEFSRMVYSHSMAARWVKHGSDFELTKEHPIPHPIPHPHRKAVGCLMWLILEKIGHVLTMEFY